MKTPVSTVIFVVFFFFLVTCPRISVVKAQNQNGINREDPYARFSPSIAVIIVILLAALFFMGFFVIYIRHCSGSGSIRRGISMRARRAAAATRGLDASVVESFPTFTYAEVKDHKIGKGALECAVCLNEFEDEETLRLLPKCDHVFHPECVGAWLESHVTCPVCRADLVPQPGEETLPEPVVDEGTVVIQISDDVDGSRAQTPRAQERQGSFDRRNQLPAKRPNRMFSFSRFRSHSTGHDSVVRPGQDLERFTLRLPAEVRKEVITRVRSCAAAAAAATTLPRGGYRTARFLGRLDTQDRAAKSDRWAFFARAFSMKSPRVAVEAGGVEGSQRGGSIGRTAASFKYLEPSVPNSGEEIKPSSDEPERSNPV